MAAAADGNSWTDVDETTVQRPLDKISRESNQTIWNNDISYIISNALTLVSQASPYPLCYSCCIIAKGRGNHDCTIAVVQRVGLVRARLHCLDVQHKKALVYRRLLPLCRQCSVVHCGNFCIQFWRNIKFTHIQYIGKTKQPVPSLHKKESDY